MIFITINEHGCVTGSYSGATDYVHRVTGEAFPNAKQVPVGAIKVSDADVVLLGQAKELSHLCWDGTQLVQRSDLARYSLEDAIIQEECEAHAVSRRVALAALSDTELDALFASLGA